MAERRNTEPTIVGFAIEAPAFDLPVKGDEIPVTFGNGGKKIGRVTDVGRDDSGNVTYSMEITDPDVIAALQPDYDTLSIAVPPS